MDNKLAVKELISWSGEPSPFPNTDYPFPLNLSLFGKFDLEPLLQRAGKLKAFSTEEQLGIALALAEVKESTYPDKNEFFITDGQTRANLLRLNRDTGWALIWGDNSERTAKLISLLQKENFVVFTYAPKGTPLTASDVASESGPRPFWMSLPPRVVGIRPTSAVYFYQAFVRFAHIYGRIALGSTHDVGDFIQDNSSGVMFLMRRDLTPIEEAMFLGGVSLGIPAVVPPAFQCPCGNLLVADEPEDMVEKAMSLPNMRVRRHIHFQANLPFPFDYSYTSEEIKNGRTTGGTPASSFVVVNENKGNGFEVIGELDGGDVGIEIAVGDPRVDICMTEYLEEFAARLPAYMQGVSVEVKAGGPIICWHPEMRLEASHLAQAYYIGLKSHFNLEPMRIRLVFKPDLLPSMKEKADAFREERRRVLTSIREETEPFFYACTRCHAFALEHACIITPERPSQCGTRTWSHIKARASLSEFDARGLAKMDTGPDLQAVVEKGQCVNQAKGEYVGINSAVQRLTSGRTSRILLHSIFEHPHTACSCFQCVAFHIREVDSIGLIDKVYKGLTPDGRNWDQVANAVAGKQVSGLVGFGREYMKSGKFLLGDGGWQRVAWMPARLKEEFARDKPWIATEAQIKDVTQLKAFYGHLKKSRIK